MRDEDTNEAIGIFPGAFELRPGERDLSVDWMEIYSDDRGEQLRQIVKHAELKLRANHGYGVIQVGAFQDACTGHGARVRIIHEATALNPAHAAVHQYPRDNVGLMAELANLAGETLTLVGDIGQGGD